MNPQGLRIPRSVALTVTGITAVLAAETQKEAAERHRFDPVIQKIVGWTVHVDRLLSLAKRSAGNDAFNHLSWT